MIANYGYKDGSGDYYFTLDTDKCDGCGECVAVCDEKVLEMSTDDYGKNVARVRDVMVRKLGDVCPGLSCGSRGKLCCTSVCKCDAVTHTW